LAAEMQANRGLITRADLKNYRPAVRQPLRGTYRGHEVVTMPPPSSGGVALIEMLNMLERQDVKSLGHNSSRKYHLLTEVMRRAFADRAEYMGDPGFVEMPIAGLTSKRYATDLLKGVDLEKATPSVRVKAGRPAANESPQTTHFSVVDAQGNAVSNTYTLNTAYGSGVTVKGAGFLLNNEMDDFTSKPGVPNAFGLIQGEANSIAPGKRPLSSMTPSLVLKDGKLVLVVGSPGGPTIINTVLQVIVNVVDHGMNVRQAVTEPRIHHQWLPDTIQWEPYGMSADVADALRAKGHSLADTQRYIGDAQVIMIDPRSGFRLGASDPRSPDGLATGY
ncbi:MAG: gamma-glutamyltransferase 1, Threonine peptidase family, partial [Armatimonadetes bacterium]|nr:gamma-glutamyltransferase 1, Threonine peptidase family [Armatimonadota bacterium]